MSSLRRSDRDVEGYQELQEEISVPSARLGGGDEDTAGDLALAMALSREDAEQSGRSLDTQRDEELALALAMTMDDEYQANVTPGQLRRRSSSSPRAQPKSQAPIPEIAPRKQTVDPAGIAQTMFDRIMATFGGRSTSTEKREENKSRVERYKARKSRQLLTTYNVMEVILPMERYLPDFRRTEYFLVMKPDGTISDIHVPLHFQHSPFYLTYDGEPLIKSSPRILDEAEQMTAFIDYYRFDPVEIETNVDIIPGPRPLGGLELVSQPEGVFVRWGIFPLSPSFTKSSPSPYDEEEDTDEELERQLLETHGLVLAGDLIVQVGGAPITSLENLRSLLSSFPQDSSVEVRVLRKPTPTVRCPMGHRLQLDDRRAAMDAECDSCRSSFGRHHCVECGFSLCWPCFQTIYNHSKARFPIPVNNDHEFTEAPRTTRLTSTPADIGVKLLIFWYTTAEWWIGQIESFDPAKGHVVVYEERNGELCRETVPDFSCREYRILTHCVLNSETVEPFHAQTLGEKHNDRSVLEEESRAPLPMDLLSSNVFEETGTAESSLMETNATRSRTSLPSDLMFSLPGSTALQMDSTSFEEPEPIWPQPVQESTSYAGSSVSAPYQSKEDSPSGLSGSFLAPMPQPFETSSSQKTASLDERTEESDASNPITPSGLEKATEDPVLTAVVGEESEAQVEEDEDKVLVNAEEAELLKELLGEGMEKSAAATGGSGDIVSSEEADMLKSILGNTEDGEGPP